MNGNYDGASGLYGVVQYVVMAELGQLWDQSSKARAGARSLRFVIVTLTLSLAVLLASGTGF